MPITEFPFLFYSPDQFLTSDIIMVEDEEEESEDSSPVQHPTADLTSYNLSDVCKCLIEPGEGDVRLRLDIHSLDNSFPTCRHSAVIQPGDTWLSLIHRQFVKHCDWFCFLDQNRRNRFSLVLTAVFSLLLVDKYKRGP